MNATRVYEGMIISIDGETDAPGYNDGSGMVKHPPYGVTWYRVNGVRVTPEDAQDALERAALAERYT